MKIDIPAVPNRSRKEIKTGRICEETGPEGPGREGKAMEKKQVVNPYLPSWEYVPDGEPHVFGDRVYVYGSHDRFDGDLFCMNDYICYSADFTLGSETEPLIGAALFPELEIDVLKIV